MVIDEVKSAFAEIFNFEYIMIEGREVNSEYLLETKTIDYGNPMIQEKVSELRSDTKTMIEYIQKAYEFVRDNISGGKPYPLSLTNKVKSSPCLRAVMRMFPPLHLGVTP